MKVAFLSFDFGEYCMQLASGLAKEVELLLLLSQQEARSHGAALDPAVRFFPFREPRLRQVVRQAQTMFMLLRQIRLYQPDVVHIQECQLWFNFFLPFLKRYPLVVTIHDPQLHLGDRDSHIIPQWLCDFAYRQGNQIIVHAESLKDVVRSRLHMADQIVHVIPHVTLADPSLQPSVLQTQTSKSHHEHVVLFFGRIWEYKGLEYLIRAEPLISRQVPNVRIVIAGQGEDFQRYRAMMVHPERFTVYNEYISDEQRSALFQQASIVVLPYVEASQSGVIPLAYACAKPVVATNVGGLPEFVEHGRTGLLVPPRDECQLAEAIVRLLQDTALRHQLGANGKHKLTTECSPAVVAQQTIAVYRRAIEEARQSVWV